MPRRYTLGKRADAMADTRRRIIEAAVALHGSIGPARTTISAVAERAGVERLTVYRHFADEAAIYRACSAHWRALHPVPDPATWTVERDPRARTRRALREMYTYYRQNRAMIGLILRDAPSVPALAESMDQRRRALARAAAALLAAWPSARRRNRRLRAAVAHALAFDTWASLASSGLPDAGAVDLMAGLVARASHPRTPHP